MMGAFSMMKKVCILLWVVFVCVTSGVFAENQGKITIAAAADLKYAMYEIVTEFKKNSPGSSVEVVYGSSGKVYTQIVQGAPFDLFFSADIKYPLDLLKKGFGAAEEVKTYAFGRIVLWSSTLDSTKLTLRSLSDPLISRIAIANPAHAPYGVRAREALQSIGLWDKVEKKCVYGENIAQAAQFAATGNAQVGIIGLSIALNPEMLKNGHYVLIPDTLYAPLEQGCIILKRAADNKLARSFADFMEDSLSRKIMKRYGFLLPGEM